MLDLDQIREKLRDRNLSEVGRRLNITRSYLSFICKKNSTANPSYEMIKKISDYLEDRKTLSKTEIIEKLKDRDLSKVSMDTGIPRFLLVTPKYFAEPALPWDTLDVLSEYLQD